ncbi:uncharacterized protein LOC126784128 [Argentina anserina]|uniref:uncharacterized protein LOC126784128 n=1 Tax=Argentina anserina TaxID=57926 RepID=UPI0021768A74|nr:uncharacterized protein LOC126784128 [Potentilla anserina]
MGDDVVGWLAMAERYINAQHIPPEERVAAVAANFGPNPSLWMNFYEQRNPNPTWEQFVVAFMAHFGGGTITDYKTALSHLLQTSSVDAFISEFTLLACRIPEWTNDDFLSMFLGGLKPEIQHDVRLLDPRTLADAQRMARRYERKLQDKAISRPSRPFPWQTTNRQTNLYPATSLSSTTSSSSQLHPSQSRTPNTASAPNSNPRPPTGTPFCQWSSAHQRERRAQGLCLHCDDKWSPNHVCKNPVLAILEALTPCEPSALEEEEVALIDAEQPDPLPLHAITTTNSHDMMRFKGSINGLPIDVFVDCGSVKNFLSPVVAAKVGCTISPPARMGFTTTTGEPIKALGTAEHVTVEIQSYKFTRSFQLLQVVNCDLLLGCEWLSTLGFIGMHFAEKVMVFTAESRCHAHDPCIQALLHAYADLFSTPTGLPPKRNIDHCIPLILGTTPVNVRPYRYAHSQKSELETQVLEMLDQGIIRPSRSPYSSHVLLVRKNERTWRFCIDYRAPNAVTVKDRFPIPNVDELLDELHGVLTSPSLISTPVTTNFV